MNNLSRLSISQPFIALFGSGNSVHQLSETDFERIRAQAFVVTLNYAPLRLKGHLNMWSDRMVSDFLENHFAHHPKECLLLAQEGRVGDRLKGRVDYWFNRQKEKLDGNYTIVWALQLLQRYFPDKKILLFGVDMHAPSKEQAKWYDRYTDFDKRKRGTSFKPEEKLQQCGAELAHFVDRRNVYNCNPESRLTHFEKKDWRELLHVRILHLCPSALAGSPVHLSRILNKFTYCESKTILKKEFALPQLNRLKWDYDLINPSDKQLKEAIEWADLIHFHRDLYPHDILNKPRLIQYHSVTSNYVPGKTHVEYNNKKLVVAQHQPLVITDALPVPNLIDIWSDELQPGLKPANKIKIFYSWASEGIGPWQDKGSATVKNILNRIKNKYGSAVEISIRTNTPYHICLEDKRTANICIDDCSTGSYHLQSLEGCSVGAVTFNNLDDNVHSFLKAVCGTSIHPFVKSNLDGLYEALIWYLNNPDEILQKGMEARRWMENYWDPRKLVSRYTNAYFNILKNNTVFPETNQKKSNDEASGQMLKTDTQILHFSSSNPNLLKMEPPSTNNGVKAFGNIIRCGKPLTDLYQKYANQDIYIFGTGPSLLKAPLDFFKDKICLGINYSFEIVDCMDYVLVHDLETYDVIKNIINNNQLILSETLVNQASTKPGNRHLPHRLPVENDLAYIYPIQDPYEKNINNKHVKLDRHASIFTWSTTTHSAIHIAAYMGAKNIYLIGVDYELYENGQVHFQSRHSQAYAKQNWNAHEKHRMGERWLAGQLAHYGIRVINISKGVGKM